MSAATGISASVQPTCDLRFVCPRCRAPLDSEYGRDHCADCGFTISRVAGVTSFVTDTSATDWQQYFEAKAAAPDGDTSAGVAYRFSIQHRYMIDAFRRLCGHVPAAALVLDVGCGNGLFSEAMFGQRQIVGVDYSLGMCSRARARGIRVYHADAMALPFADAQFDLVYSAEIVQYIDDLPAFIAELARVCRPGSAIIVSTLNRSSLLRRASSRIKEILLRRSAEPSTTIMRSMQDMLAAAELSHLQVGKVCWSHFPFPWQHFTASTRYRFELLASNLIVEFIKIGR